LTLCIAIRILQDMNDNKVQLNIRLTPELRAYLKKRAPENMSRYVNELIRKDALDNMQDDNVVARLQHSILKDDAFWERVEARVDSRYNLLKTDI